jgi:hypothetical protein
MGDKIILAGELGQEMYFLQSGVVEVVSADENTIFARLPEGSFFGETALFLKNQQRTATIRAASSICICYSIKKSDFDKQLNDFEFDASATFNTFLSLQQGNQAKNKAITSNLAKAKDPDEKLFKLIDFTPKKDSLWMYYRKLFSIGSSYRLLWTLSGLIILVYYIFIIPFRIAFIFGEHYISTMMIPYLPIDFFCDLYWLADIFLRCAIFPGIALDGTAIFDGDEIFRRYKDNGHFYLDIVASLPLELFALCALKDSYEYQFVLLSTLRLVHLLRAWYIVDLMNMAENMVAEMTKITIKGSIFFFIKTFFFYLVVNHWLACMYFMVHRYPERESAMTWVIADKKADFDPILGKHNICNVDISYCYARAVYFVLGTMTSVGYGDVAPFTNLEFLMEQFVALVGACMAAALCGACSTYLAENDAMGDNMFRYKIDDVKKFISFRSLKSDLSEAILAQYYHIWRLENRTGTCGSVTYMIVFFFPFFFFFLSQQES